MNVNVLLLILSNLTSDNTKFFFQNSVLMKRKSSLTRMDIVDGDTSVSSSELNGSSTLLEENNDNLRQQEDSSDEGNMLLCDTTAHHTNNLAYQNTKDNTACYDTEDHKESKYQRSSLKSSPTMNKTESSVGIIKFAHDNRIMKNDLNTLLTRETDFGFETGELLIYDKETSIFAPDPDNLSYLAEAKVLVIGAGGLGCEILKNLALSGVKDIHVIDLDTIDLSNLNRQFLFRRKDIGESKAKTAANFIMERCTSVTVTPYHCKIQEKSEDFYRQFNIIIAGLDNIEARSWLNSMIFSLAQIEENGNDDDEGIGTKYNPETIIPMIDGGTEEFQGQARVIIPGKTACFNCTIDQFVQTERFQICTIAETPRQPEHCIIYAKQILWEKHFASRPFDADKAEDVKWIYDRAVERANQFNIEGITYRLTLGVVKNIIPAIASTNAIIAAACANEAIKLLTGMARGLNNYMYYNGNDGIATSTIPQQIKENCIVCQNVALTKIINPNMKLEEFIELLKTDSRLSLKKPSFSVGRRNLYFSAGILEKSTRSNLEKTMKELEIQSGESINVADISFANTITVKIMFDVAN